MLTDDGYRQIMQHARRLAQGGRGELAQHLRDAIDLRAEVEALTAQLQSGESFHAVAVRQRDAAWKEIEALKATLTQQCKGFRADVEKLEAEVAALRADAERYRWMKAEVKRIPPGWALIGWDAAVDAARKELAEQDAAVDAARAAQGDKT